MSVIHDMLSTYKKKFVPNGIENIPEGRGMINRIIFQHIVKCLVFTYEEKI